MNLIPLTGIPKVKPGDEISTFIIKSIKRKKIKISKNDLIVIAHKIISISGRYTKFLFIKNNTHP